MLALDDHWVWDSWYLHDGDALALLVPQGAQIHRGSEAAALECHARACDQRRSCHVAASFHSCLRPSASGWDDYTVWTGSTLRGDDGRWHYFYTGTSRAEDGLIQRIGHAVGDDLETWARVEDGLCLDLTGPNAALYETHHEGRWHDRAMRDPWVMKDPQGAGWLMYFTARVPDGEVNDAGNPSGALLMTKRTLASGNRRRNSSQVQLARDGATVVSSGASRQPK